MNAMNTGQSNITNMEILSNKPRNEEEMKKTIDKPPKNLPQYQQMLIEEEDILSLLVEIEYKHNLELDNSKLVPTTIVHICSLIEKWQEAQLIDRVYVKGKNFLEYDLNDFGSWAYELRIIKRKDKNIVECIF